MFWKDISTAFSPSGLTRQHEWPDRIIKKNKAIILIHYFEPKTASGHYLVYTSRN
jgi:hypothetical protein